MGRPYATEMGLLPTTYAWAMGADITQLAAGVCDAAVRPLIALGSGGSLTAAHLVADLHQRATGKTARVMTPYELVALGGPPRDAGVIMFSAGGRNADIRAALDVCLAADSPVLMLVTGAPDSPAARTALAARYPRVAGYELAAGRDGFLATNSLLAFVVLTSRAYAAAGVAACDLPPEWEALVGSGAPPPGEMLDPGQALVTLHGPTTHAGAVDLESKCTEAGLAVVQLADYRNFAHGRHHWLVKHRATVLSLEGPEDHRAADRTLALLPRGQRVIRYRCAHAGSAGAVEGVAYAMRFAGALGQAAGIDPGRPGVPEFGSKLYSLKVIAQAAPPPDPELPLVECVAIERKARRSVTEIRRAGALGMWRSAYLAARETLEGATFGATAFDYDGTLVDAEDRFRGPRREVVAALETLLRAGVPVGIATGRGRSAARELREHLASALWDRILVGYYNGGHIAPLSDEAAPESPHEVRAPLRPALEALSGHALLAELAVISPRLPQITVEPREKCAAPVVWDLVAEVLSRVAGEGIRAVRSSHSIDVLAPGVSKRLLVQALRQRYSMPDGVRTLCIGDRGQSPGNDAEMLASLDAVSVDEVSADPAHAWRWSQPGRRGVEATLELLRCLTVGDATKGPEARGVFRVRLNEAAVAAERGPRAR